MTKQEKIDEINIKYDRDYRLTKNNRIYTVFMGEKMFFTLDEIVERIEELECTINANENSKIVRKHIENNGGVLLRSSSTGSYYYSYKGHKVRISNHDFTSQFYLESDYNLCSYQKNGHTELIEKINSIN